MEPGIYNDMSNEAYHGIPDVLHASGIKLFTGKTPAHFHEQANHKSESTPAMVIGSATHTAVLEPGLYPKEVAVMPQMDRRTKAGKAQYALFEANSKGKIIVSEYDHSNIQRMATSVRSHKTASRLLQNGIAESSVFWEDPAYGFLCAIRPDWYPGNGIIVDLKTCEDASPEGFQRAAFKFGYHIQAAWYLEGMGQATKKIHDKFIFICVEKKSPYAVAVYEADNDFINYGKAEIDMVRFEYSECLASGIWPAYNEGVLSLSLPKWA